MSDNLKVLIGLIIAILLTLYVANGIDQGRTIGEIIGVSSYTTTSTSETTYIDPQTLREVTTTTTVSETQPGKTLWDWLELLIIPAILSIGVWWLNQRVSEREQEREDKRSEREQRLEDQRSELERNLSIDSQQQAALEGYLDRMSELLLKEDLLRRKADKGEPVRNVAQARTTTVLRILDLARRNIVLQFLRDAGLSDAILINANLQGADLVHTNLSTINLQRASLREANLQGANLIEANLQGADLCKANLQEACLWDANLQGANLWQANLQRTILWEANLQGANLEEANLREAHMLDANLRETNLREADMTDAKDLDKQLAEAKSWDGLTMPDGKIYDGRFDKGED